MLELGGETLILTHDAMAEGVHFLPGQDPADVAWKLVATNLSDLAAKGAEPLGVLLGYQLGVDDARFVAGLREVLEHYRVPLLGGDTVSATGLAALQDNKDLISYFQGNGHRMAACRAMLDLLEIPAPGWAYRNPSGRAAQTATMVASFRDDNPHVRFDR